MCDCIYIFILIHKYHFFMFIHLQMSYSFTISRKGREALYTDRAPKGGNSQSGSGSVNVSTTWLTYVRLPVWVHWHTPSPSLRPYPTQTRLAHRRTHVPVGENQSVESPTVDRDRNVKSLEKTPEIDRFSPSLSLSLHLWLWSWL